MAIEKITKFSDAIQPADIINEVVDVVNNADLEEFVGASESQAGKKGIVPAPEAGSEDRYLNADGTWKEVKQNLTTYTSLEQLGITPGEETFASIHNALPLNSVLEYYAEPNNNYNDEFYPVTNYHGILQAVKLNSTKTIFSFYDHEVPQNSIEFSELYLSAYDSAFSDSRTTVWNKVLSSETEATQVIRSSLLIKRPSDYAQLTIMSSNSRERRLDCGTDYLRLAAMTDEDTDVGGRYIVLSTTNPLSNSLYLQENISGTWTSYNLFGQHNIASQSEAETGTINSKPMTPLRVKQAITKNLSSYLTTSSASSTYLPKTGGTITGNLTVNGKLNATASAANSLTYLVLNDGSGSNKTGYRLIATIPIKAWTNERGIFVIKSRHSGGGVLCVSIGCNSETVSQANVYAEIKYHGPIDSGNIIHNDSFLIYVSSNGANAYLFWKYTDYNTTCIYTIASDFSLSNGTWMETINTATYGAQKASVHRTAYIDTANHLLFPNGNELWIE